MRYYLFQTHFGGYSECMSITNTTHESNLCMMMLD